MKHTHINSLDDLLTDFEKYNLSITLGGRSPFGFFQYYFYELPHHRTKIEAFNHVNELYFDLFGEYRYEDYNSFRLIFSKNQKQFYENLKTPDND